MKSTAHIQDPTLKDLYVRVNDDAWRVLTVLGPAALDTIDDKLAVLQALSEACRVIISDLKEHGEEHSRMFYEDHPIEFFEKERERFETAVASARAAGAQSDVFERWKNPKIDTKDKQWRKARR